MGCTQYEFSTTDNRSSRLVDIAYNLCKFLYNKCNHNYQSVYLVIYRFQAPFAIRCLTTSIHIDFYTNYATLQE